MPFIQGNTFDWANLNLVAFLHIKLEIPTCKSQVNHYYGIFSHDGYGPFFNRKIRKYLTRSETLPTNIKLPDFGRLAIRVLVRDPGGGGAQGPRAEHAVNLGGGGHRDEEAEMRRLRVWVHKRLETNWNPVLMTCILKVWFYREIKASEPLELRGPVQFELNVDRETTSRLPCASTWD